MEKQSKASFVRSFGSTTSAKDIIAAGKEKDIKLSPQYIYVIRSKGRVTPKAAPKAGPKTLATAMAPRVPSKRAEAGNALLADLDKLRTLIKRVGTVAAETILNELK